MAPTWAQRWTQGLGFRFLQVGFWVFFPSGFRHRRFLALFPTSLCASRAAFGAGFRQAVAPVFCMIAHAETSEVPGTVGLGFCACKNLANTMGLEFCACQNRANAVVLRKQLQFSSKNPGTYCGLLKLTMGRPSPCIFKCIYDGGKDQ